MGDINTNIRIDELITDMNQKLTVLRQMIDSAREPSIVFELDETGSKQLTQGELTLVNRIVRTEDTVPAILCILNGNYFWFVNISAEVDDVTNPNRLIQATCFGKTLYIGTDGELSVY